MLPVYLILSRQMLHLYQPDILLIIVAVLIQNVHTPLTVPLDIVLHPLCRRHTSHVAHVVQVHINPVPEPAQHVHLVLTNRHIHHIHIPVH